MVKEVHGGKWVNGVHEVNGVHGVHEGHEGHGVKEVNEVHGAKVETQNFASQNECDKKYFLKINEGMIKKCIFAADFKNETRRGG